MFRLIPVLILVVCTTFNAAKGLDNCNTPDNGQDLSVLEFTVRYVRHERVMSFFPFSSGPEETLVGLYSTTLTNKGSDTISFTSMVCSYWQFYTFNDSSFYPYYTDPCYANWPIEVHLAPQERYTSNIFLMPKEGIQMDSIDLKFGIRIIHPNDFKFASTCSLYCDTINSVWSEPIKIYNIGY